MANCRIQNLTPVCGYTGDGAVSVRLLDLEDFAGYVFENNGPFDSCFVEILLRTAPFVVLDTRNELGQYSGPYTAGVYTHTLEVFIPDITADLIAELHLATKRPQLVVFETAAGRFFAFGSDGGANLTYTALTEGGAGVLVTLSAMSKLPLFGVAAETLGAIVHPSYYVPYFDDFAVCEIDEATDEFTGFQQASISVRVSAITGEPVDINGAPTAESGLKQAALSVEGTTAPAEFEQAGTFPRAGLVNGTPSVRYAPEVCPAGTAAPWVLETGFWDMGAYWLDDGIWNY